ncbi:MAG: hypothetical protein FWG05_06145, partial [Kiritimatiellaeota bacterium]|nr:hypothetical protein [Kiritimatiellota bacterium]
MKRIGKLFFDFAYVVTGFTAAHSVVALSAGKNKALYGDIVYNSSYDLTWAVLFYVFPLLVGLSVGLCLKRWNTKFVKWFCVAVCCAQVAFTSYAMFENHRYWGYCAKRPAVFTEYENISGFIGFSTISNKVQNDSDNAAGLPADPDEAAWDALRKIGFQKMPEKSRDDPNDFEVLSTVSRESEWRDFQRNEKTGSIDDSYYAFYSRPDFNIYDSRT